MSVFRFLLCLLVLSDLAGCIPLWSTKQPSATFRVVDEHGSPILGARVKLLTYSVSFVPKESETSVDTSQEGLAYFKGEKFFQWYIPLPDAGEFYKWAYCVELPGYTSGIGNNLESSSFNSILVIRLEKSELNHSCYRAKDQYGYAVQNR